MMMTRSPTYADRHPQCRTSPVTVRRPTDCRHNVIVVDRFYNADYINQWRNRPGSQLSDPGSVPQTILARNITQIAYH